MTTEMWNSAATGLAQFYGISNEAMLLVISVLASLGIAIFIIRATGQKSMGIPAFFLTWAIMIFLFGWNWIVFIIPLLLVGAFIYKKGGFH